ncbi:hypothetical protein AMTR_s00002p00271810, partial [Amborella trichopoda]
MKTCSLALSLPESGHMLLDVAPTPLDVATIQATSNNHSQPTNPSWSDHNYITYSVPFGCHRRATSFSTIALGTTSAILNPRSPKPHPQHHQSLVAPAFSRQVMR